MGKSPKNTPKPSTKPPVAYPQPSCKIHIPEPVLKKGKRQYPPSKRKPLRRFVGGEGGVFLASAGMICFT